MPDILLPESRNNTQYAGFLLSLKEARVKEDQPAGWSWTGAGDWSRLKHIVASLLEECDWWRLELIRAIG